jgi:hypothetical protein
MATGNCARGPPSRSRRRIAARFWRSINFGLRADLDGHVCPRPRAWADQCSYALFDVVEEKLDPTSVLFQTILNGSLWREYECEFENGFHTSRRAPQRGIATLVGRYNILRSATTLQCVRTLGVQSAD